MTEHALFLVCAGVLAGAVGTAGGIMSLVSYPALLAVGLTALAANVANNVAYVASWPGSTLASRLELEGRAAWLRHWVPVVAGASAVGAALLVLTPPGIFARIVPFLVLTGSLALLAEPRLTSWYQRRGARHSDSLLAAGMLAVGIYQGYFGAGSGVMVLTLLLLLVERHIPRANALKNMLLGASGVCTALVLVLFAHVDWSAVVPLAAGVLAGARFGPVLARRVPANVIRPLIALLGFALAIQLWIHPGS